MSHFLAGCSRKAHKPFHILRSKYLLRWIVSCHLLFQLVLASTTLAAENRQSSYEEMGFGSLVAIGLNSSFDEVNATGVYSRTESPAFPYLFEQIYS